MLLILHRGNLKGGLGIRSPHKFPPPLRLPEAGGRTLQTDSLASNAYLLLVTAYYKYTLSFNDERPLGSQFSP